MKLYKVFKYEAHYKDEKFIIAFNKKEAIVKYYEITCTSEHYHVIAEMICERDVIIPTLEPLKEFIK